MLRSPDHKIKCSSESDLTKTPTNNEEQNVNTRKRKQPDPDCSQAVIIQTITMELKRTIDGWFSDLNLKIEKDDARMSSISENINNIKSDLTTLTQVTAEIKGEIHSLRSEQMTLKRRIDEQDVKNNTLSMELQELKETVQNHLDHQIDIQKHIDVMNKQNKTYTQLQDTVVGLEAKLDSMEQSARQCNIEICNIPEKRNENLIAILENIGSVINYSISSKDVAAIHRVPHAHQQNNKPKNIIVKMTSRILRDNILSACRLKKDFNADKLGFPNSSLPIHIHEHLTLKNKQLFRECKAEAAKFNYKFVWVKHGTILVREKEGAKAIAIKCRKDVEKIKKASLLSAPTSNV